MGETVGMIGFLASVGWLVLRVVRSRRLPRS